MFGIQPATVFPGPPIFAATNHSTPEEICFDGLVAVSADFTRL